jgi:Putative Ig domain
VTFGPTTTGAKSATLNVNVGAPATSTAVTLTGTATAGTGIVLVQSNSAQGTGVTSLPVAFSSANTAGNLIIAFVRMSGATIAPAPVTLTDTRNNVYVLAVAQAQTTDGSQVRIYYARTISAGANTVTATFSASNLHPWLAVYEYAGLNTLDQTASAQGINAAPSTGPTLTTTSGTELVFAGLGLPSGLAVTPTAGAGFTIRGTNLGVGNSQGATEATVVTATGPQTGTFVLSTNANWSAVVATFSAGVVIVPPVTITTTTLPNGSQNVAYNTTLAATGGTTPYTWSIVAPGTLPTGLSLNSGSGVISGTPTVAGTTNFTVRVTDATLATATQALSLTVNPPAALAITTTTLPAGTQNVAYTTTVAATGGTTPYTWSLVAPSTLPTGLALASGTGVISGTPTVAGTTNFTVRVTDASLATTTQALSITININTPIALAQPASTSSGSAGPLTAVSTAFGANNTAGNLIIAFVRMSTSTQTVTVTDSLGNVYTQAAAAVQIADGSQVHLFYARNILGGANTVTATFSASNNHPWLAVYEYRGLSTTAPLDQTASGTGSGTAASTAPTPTTTSANELVFAGFGLPASYTGTQAAGTGFTILNNVPNTGATALSVAATESKPATVVGAQTGTFNLGTVANWSAIVATFKQ